MKHYRAAEQALPIIIGLRPMVLLRFYASAFANSLFREKAG